VWPGLVRTPPSRHLCSTHCLEYSVVNFLVPCRCDVDAAIRHFPKGQNQMNCILSACQELLHHYNPSHESSSPQHAAVRCCCQEGKSPRRAGNVADIFWQCLQVRRLKLSQLDQTTPLLLQLLLATASQLHRGCTETAENSLSLNRRPRRCCNCCS